MMVAVMRLAAVLLCGFFAAGSGFGADDAPARPALAQVKTVYLLPMTNGLDQYLANRITRGGVLQVVTEPEKADAIMTDRLGPAFERKAEELFPARKPAAEPKKDEGTAEAQNRFPGNAGTIFSSSFGRAKGTVFLVSAKNGSVLWSVFEQQAGTRPGDLDRTAEKIVKTIQQDLKRKPSR